MWLKCSLSQYPWLLFVLRITQTPNNSSNFFRLPLKVQLYVILNVFINKLFLSFQTLGCSRERDASVTTKGPLRKDGKPDMRFKINKEAYGKSSFQKNTEDSYSESERTLALVLDLPACSSERDARKPASPAQISRSAVTSSSCEFKGPLKKDGTPDMRFASNNQSASSMSSLSSYSSASGPIKKKDNAPDMRYAANKSSYDGPSSSGYWPGGSFYSTELLASLASPGPLESDGTPDMRYAANRSSYASPCSYGGSAYSSGSSSIDGTPDMRYAANNSCYDGPPSSGYWSLYDSSSPYGGSNYSSGSSSSESSFDGSSSCGPLKKDGTPDMRYAVNKSLYGSLSSYGGSTCSSRSSARGSSSRGPLKKDGTPDMRFKANRR